MSKNYVMLMAEFVYSHPEYQMIPPRVWKAHFEDEFKEENKICSFSVLKRYPSLVRIEKQGRNSLYGSAKLPVKTTISSVATPSSTLSANKISSDITNKLLIKTKNNKSNQPLETTENIQNKQLKLDLSAELALDKINQTMLQASKEIDQIVQQFKSKQN